MKIYFLLLILSLTPLFVAAQGPSTNSSNNTYYDLNSTAPLVFILFVAAAFFTGFIAIFMRHYCHFDTVDGALPLYAAAATSRQHQLSPGGQRRLCPAGLDPAVINCLPVLKYSEIKRLRIGDGEALSCAVCVSEFEDDERLRLLPKCDHVFHLECIDLWFSSHSTCPICRANLSQGIKPMTQSTAEYNSRREAQNQISISAGEEVETATRERVRMFPRPHSTGHSLVQLGEDCESQRYTLRLPEEDGRPVDRLDRGGTSGKWFCMTPPFFTITGSLRPAKVGETDDHEVMAVGTS